MDFVMKHYGNHGEGEGSQVIPLCNVGKTFHILVLSPPVSGTFLTTHLGHISVENNTPLPRPSG